jgi:large subunit ribosomal protein L18
VITKEDRNKSRARRHRRVRARVTGTAERPRLNVFRSNKHIYAQVIDDVNGLTLASASTKEKAFGEETESRSTVEAAKKVGDLVAKRALEKGLSAVVFDRGGYLYHGRVQALADAAREAGLQF